jgi:hypothetical protein
MRRNASLSAFVLPFVGSRFTTSAFVHFVL